ncbi:MAG: monovalent cation/H(+) antiporter subunit G [Thermoanaerobaculia bacterium]
MTSTIITAVLLATAVLLELVGAIGLLWLRTTKAKLHYASGTTSAGVILVAIALLVANGLSPGGGKALLAAVLVGILGGAVTHTIGAEIHRAGKERR